MIKMFCNKCGKEIEGTTYYTINIVGKDIEPVSNYESCADTYSYNISQSLLKALTKEKHYCKECKDKVEAFLWRNTVEDDCL